MKVRQEERGFGEGEGLVLCWGEGFGRRESERGRQRMQVGEISVTKRSEIGVDVSRV